MATLTFKAKIQTWWEATVNINFTAEYDPATNRTTVTFDESSFAYFGRNQYGTSATANITVKAADNAGSSGNAALSTYGYTNGGVKTFTGTPSPAQIVVQHSDAPGNKSVIISASSTISVYATSTATTQSTATGSGETTVKTGGLRGGIRIDSGVSFETCLVYIDNGSAWEQIIPEIDNGSAWEILS